MRARVLEVDVVVEPQFVLIFIVGLGLRHVSVHLNDLVAIGLPKLISKDIEELNDGMGILGVPICRDSCRVHCHGRVSHAGSLSWGFGRAERFAFGAFFFRPARSFASRKR